MSSLSDLLSQFEIVKQTINTLRFQPCACVTNKNIYYALSYSDRQLTLGMIESTIQQQSTMCQRCMDFNNAMVSFQDLRKRLNTAIQITYNVSTDFLSFP